ncbi:nitrite reductase (NAD(P)H) small subunit [Paenibacillus sp. 1011MAR3C5]|uniref:nitrite reductase small subunit NirD n=1 Tax=Paenibacillus sp. 1011MAR3C5 TaxID=1675787 RepID=UPI000E6C4AA4|nr:nitrite reductase small subunit NirD [Paenibacillus sp. 1011MAR3C5]RJE83861.1 nitrite reductase (NAD(P)H) small subunit [Paenibacillus sp. 1011MAR3C5]
MLRTEKATFASIGLIEDFPVGLGREVRMGNVQIAVFRTTDGIFYALENRTPHAKGGTLAEALVSGHYIYCPIRDLKISLETGLVQAPDTGQVRKFDIRAVNGIVEVALNGAPECTVTE